MPDTNSTKSYKYLDVCNWACSQHTFSGKKGAPVFAGGDSLIPTCDTTSSTLECVCQQPKPWPGPKDDPYCLYCPDLPYPPFTITLNNNEEYPPMGTYTGCYTNSQSDVVFKFINDFD